MILYHGTNAEFDIIDLAKSNRFKDFGQGFYLTDIRQQAAESTILSLPIILLIFCWKKDVSPCESYS